MSLYTETQRASRRGRSGRRLVSKATFGAAFKALTPLVPLLLVVTGLALITAAAWVVHISLGLACAGLSCLAIERGITE